MKPKFAETWWDKVPVTQLRQEIQAIYQVLARVVTSWVPMAEGDPEVHRVGQDDIGSLIIIDQDTDTTVAIPPGVIERGQQFEVARLGAGAVTVEGGTGVTVNGIEGGSFTLPTRWSRVTVLCLGDNRFLVT